MINKRAAKKQGSFLAALSHTRGGPDNFDNGLRDFLLWGGLVECSCPLTAITGGCQPIVALLSASAGNRSMPKPDEVRSS